MMENCDDLDKDNDKSFLYFDASKHCIVNLVSTLTNYQLLNLINKSGDTSLATEQIVKAVPLPGVQHLSGNIIHQK